jgi:hypothetical protein
VKADSWFGIRVQVNADLCRQPWPGCRSIGATEPAGADPLDRIATRGRLWRTQYGWPVRQYAFADGRDSRDVTRKRFVMGMGIYSPEYLVIALLADSVPDP